MGLKDDGGIEMKEYNVVFTWNETIETRRVVENVKASSKDKAEEIVRKALVEKSELWSDGDEYNGMKTMHLRNDYWGDTHIDTLEFEVEESK